MFQRVTVVQNGLVLPRGAKTLPQAGVNSIYVISGGSIRLLSLVGFVATAIQAQANATKLQAKATGQTAVDLCAPGDISGLALGQMVGITGVAANALQFGWAIVGQTTPWNLLPGTIDVNCAASNTGAFRWVLRYEALEPGAFVVAA